MTMRIYEGTPRQNWEEVLRAIGSWADHEPLKELLFMEMNGGFLVQGLGSTQTGVWSENTGLTKRTHELTDDQVAQLIDDATERRGSAESNQPKTAIMNYYEQALRIIGGWLDGQHPRDLFFFEQDGSFVIRMMVTTSTGGITHKLAEFTRDEILAMIEAAPEGRGHSGKSAAQ